MTTHTTTQQNLNALAEIGLEAELTKVAYEAAAKDMAKTEATLIEALLTTDESLDFLVAESLAEMHLTPAWDMLADTWNPSLSLNKIERYCTKARKLAASLCDDLDTTVAYILIHNLAHSL